MAVRACRTVSAEVANRQAATLPQRTRKCYLFCSCAGKQRLDQELKTHQKWHLLSASRQINAAGRLSSRMWSRMRVHDQRLRRGAFMDCGSSPLVTKRSRVAPKKAAASEQVTVHVVPAAVFTHKTAALVNAHAPPRKPVSGHEHDLGMVNIDHAVLTHLQPQPPGA